MSENLPQNLRYSKDHEWARLEGDDTVVIGITEHAAEQLGDIVGVEFPEVGDTLEKGAVFGEVESVKAVSELYAPVSGEVVAVNEALEDAPERVNEDTYDGGWMIKIRVSDRAELDALLDAAAYAALLAD